MISLESAEKMFSQAEQLCARWKAESFVEAIRKYQAARRLFRVAGKWAEEVLATRRIGDALHAISDNKRALQWYTRALSLSVAAGDSREQARALNGIGLSELDLGRANESLTHGQKALELSEQNGLSLEEAQSFNSIGIAYYVLGNTERALDYLGRAATASMALRDRRGEAEALLNLGYCYFYQDVRKAQDYWKRAASLASESAQRDLEAWVLNAIGLAHTMVGEEQEALSCHVQAGSLFHLIGNRRGEAAALTSTGAAHDRLGQRYEALSFYNRALILYRMLGNTNYESQNMGYVGEMYYSLGDRSKALLYFNRRLVLCQKLNQPRMEAIALSEIGVVLAGEGRLREAVSCYNRGLLLSRGAKDTRREALLLSNLGKAYEDMGNRLKALDSYGQALRLMRTAGDRANEAMVLYETAHAQRDLGNLGDAYEKIRAALDINDFIRAGVASTEMRTSYVASVYEQYELYIDLLMRMHERNPSEGRDVSAFEACENSRDRSLLESLREAHADILRGVGPELLERERRLGRELNSKAERHARLLYEKGSPQHAAAAEKDVEDALSRYQDTLGDIKAKSPAYAALTQPEPVTLNRIQRQVLEPDTLLLEYSLGEERSYLWVVNRNSIQSHVLPARTEIEKIARAMLPALTTDPASERNVRSGASKLAGPSQERYWHLAAQLSQILLGPIASQLGNNRLLIVADGILQYIPFSALPIPGQRAGADSEARAQVPVIAEHEIVRAPSASVLGLVRQQTAGRKPVSGAVAVVADPVFQKDDSRMAARSPSRAASKRGVRRTASLGPVASVATRQAQDQLGFSRLLFSREEAEAILALAPPDQELKALGFEANKAAVTSGRLAGYRIVHFATHAILNTDHPELSAIVLSLFDEHGKAQAGFLRAHELYNLELPVELVVLSACSTALGKDVKGEGIVGMTRGFMYAGAPRIVASLWKVDDYATAELMRLFYESMLKDGKRPAAALRAAQITMSTQKRRAFPFYWAAFELQGEWK